MKIKSEKLKSLLIIVGFFILLSICFYKNLESNIKEIYKNNHYTGEIRGRRASGRCAARAEGSA